MFGFATVAAITALVFFIAEGVKRIGFKDNLIPVLCGLVGAILGVVGYYLMPDYPAGDIMTAIVVGIESGLAATGGHQVYKQLTKIDTDDKE